MAALSEAGSAFQAAQNAGALQLVHISFQVVLVS